MTEELLNYMYEDTILVIECTGFVHLEPFVEITFSKYPRISFCSIMNEADIRQLDKNTFIHMVRNEESRIYLGTTTPDNKAITSGSMQRMTKLFQLVQQDSNDSITLLKSERPKEFLTYQWKLALPRIVFDPLCVLFEIEFPENLPKQILSSPLINGSIGELFKIIKKMDCKLVKGFENESNLLLNWSRNYPEVPNNSEEGYLHSPQLFYNYYNQLSVATDLLLLQPILLADDHNIRAPYLENMYSIMCQLNKYNEPESDSIFFTRKFNGEAVSQSKIAEVNGLYEDRNQQLVIMSDNLVRLENEKRELDEYLREKSLLRDDLDKKINMQNLGSQKLAISINHQEYKVQQLEGKRAEYEAELAQLYAFQNNPQVSQPELEQREIVPEPLSDVRENGNRYSGAPNENLEDLTDIALYGAAINKEYFEDASEDVPNEEVPAQGYPSIINREENGHAAPQMQYPPPNNPELPIAVQQHNQYKGKQMRPIASKPGSYGPGPSVTYPGPQMRPDKQYMPPYSPQMNYQTPYYPQYGDGYTPMPDQQPYGAPMHRMPPAGIPPHMRGSSMTSGVAMGKLSHQNGFAPSNGYGSKPPRLQSLSGFPMASDPYHPSLGSMPTNGVPFDPMIDSRLKHNRKKQLRRSMVPLMANDIQGLDVGGRMPTAPHGQKPKGAPNNMPKAVTPSSQRIPSNSSSTISTGQQPNRATNGYVANNNQPNDNQSNNNQPQQQSSQYLKLPDGSGASNSSNTLNTGDTPETKATPVNDFQVEVPTNNFKDLSISSEQPSNSPPSPDPKGNRKSKMKGLFKKK